jgi:putative membrane-bound dehydrogenase-like protein
MACLSAVLCLAFDAAGGEGNRLVYLDENDPFHAGLSFPKLTTPQWVGEAGVEAVVILAVDDMKETKRYEDFLRPILERLKKVDGRAPVSIMTVSVAPDDSRLAGWLKEGLSIDVHTLSHPCPLLQKSNFTAAANTYHGGVDLLNQIPGNRPVAFRMPCCDSMNSPSPRFYAEMFNRVSPGGKFLESDSSVMQLYTSADPTLPRELVLDAQGRERFRKYFPTATNAITKLSLGSFVTTIENYPYPYVIGRLCWEFPAMVPSDWEANNTHSPTNPITVSDWEAALDATVLKQGVFSFIFHPHGWIRSDQMVAFIDYAVRKHGQKVKFLTFREAQERLNKHLLGGNPIRAANGQDNGVRILDANHDGFMDVVIGNERLRQTRIWQPQTRTWSEVEFPARVVSVAADGRRSETGVRFGAVGAGGDTLALLRNEQQEGAWLWRGGAWALAPEWLKGLELDGKPVRTAEAGVDRGVRLRDTDNDGRCELLLGNSGQRTMFSWADAEKTWKKLPVSLPRGVVFVDEQGRDNGVRFADINGDGFDDLLLSNESEYAIHLYIATPRANLGWEKGWSYQARAGKRGDATEFPMFVRSGEIRNNGAWFHSGQLWVQNEDVAHMPDKVDRRSFKNLLVGNESPPKSPADALASMRVRDGFVVELAVHEPLVMDPVAFEWGADGKLWVVEMADYPLGIDGKGKAGGRVKYLEDTNGDGTYDKATLFLDGVNFPNGIYPWRKGVVVSAAPEIFYAEDTDGDGKADVRKLLFSGFREGNQQHRINGFTYGLDNWLYGANGDSGGVVLIATTGKSVDIRGRDIRIHPDDGRLELVPGQTQFGRYRDDWGNWFGNNNPNWLWHYYLPDQYLARNSNLAVRNVRNMLANYSPPNEVFSVSRPQQRFNWPDRTFQVTSANSASPYRDELFGPDSGSSVFMSEPANNVVHREVLSPDGVSFTSHRASGEERAEFLASTDNWFRPIMIKTGPDGALYIADMYRLVIEHPEYFPDELKLRPDIRDGEDKGRIYRVYPKGAKLRSIPRLAGRSTAELVSALESPNGWQRDTAQRLLVHSGDRTAAAPLEGMLAASHPPKTRLQALCTLDGLGAVTPRVLLAAIKDSHPSVREHAVRIAEPLVAASQGSAGGAASQLLPGLTSLADDPEIRVRYQLAFSLGAWSDTRAGSALARIALRDFANPAMRLAVMSAAPVHVGPMLTEAMKAPRNTTAAADLVEQLLNLATVLDNAAAVAKALDSVLRLPAGGQFETWQLASFAGFLDALDRRKLSLKAFRAQSKPDVARVLEGVNPLFDQARRLCDGVIAGGAASPDFAEAVRLLGRAETDADKDVKRLGSLLDPRLPAAIHQASLGVLGRRSEPTVPATLVARWKFLSPGLRQDVSNLLLSRQDWTQALLGAVEKNELKPADLTAATRQKLTGHASAGIREHAAKIFAPVQTDRQRLVKEYQVVHDLKGDPARGVTFFRIACATCHKFKGEGVVFGPDLGSMADKSVASLLVAILDPSQAVDAAYAGYNVVTRNGRELSGIIVAETPNSITVRSPGGMDEVVLRADIAQLTSNGLSPMPEGLEAAIKPQDMADLIAYILAAR